jgi:hypothetical protein
MGTIDKSKELLMVNIFMKLKIILMTILVIFLFSCKKNNISENIENTIIPNNIDNTIISNDNEIVTLTSVDNYKEKNGEYFYIKIIREENNGLMNIIPCNIYIYNNDMEIIDYNVDIFTHYDDSNYLKLENRLYPDYFFLIGGETAFLMLPDGNYFIKIVTPKVEQREYLPDYNNDWESKIYNFKLIQDKYFEIKIFPGNDNGYNGTWTIEE